MALTKLTIEEQLILRNKAKAEYERLVELYSDEKTMIKIEDFKNKFAMCESIYKVILEEHQYRKTGRHFDRLKILMTQVPYALTYAGYDFDTVLLAKLFGAENHVGRRSVKKLRDALTHGAKQSAIQELEIRNDELHQYMDSFLDKIRDFDTSAA